MKPIVLAVALLFSAGALQAYAEPTGSALPGLGAYDEFMLALIKKWDVPGAGLAVAHKDKLLLVRGYGLASKERALQNSRKIALDLERVHYLETVQRQLHDYSQNGSLRLRGLRTSARSPKQRPYSL